MANRVKVRSKAKVSVKRTPNKPVKAGHNDSKGVGGVVNAKVVAIVKKKRKQ